MIISLMFFSFIIGSAEATDATCVSNTELNHNSYTQSAIAHPAVFVSCGERSGYVDKRMLVSEVEVRVMGREDEAIFIPVRCNGNPCSIAEIERREWDAASVARLNANGATIFIDGFKVSGAENYNFVTDINDVRPHPTDFAIVQGATRRPLYSECRYYTNEVVDASSPGAFEGAGGLVLSQCGGQKICIAEVKCREWGKEVGTMASCLATPQGECPTADECTNRSNILVPATQINGRAVSSN